MEKKKITKQFLTEQVSSFRIAMERNKAAMELCEWMLNNCEFDEEVG